MNFTNLKAISHLLSEAADLSDPSSGGLKFPTAALFLFILAPDQDSALESEDEGPMDDRGDIISEGMSPSASGSDSVDLRGRQKVTVFIDAFSAFD